ncbi:IclR family transcriptional regulator [Arthrobacter cavernae]|uniref:Helix-turn-helix domain-containing protein n=1 Tax=Arthrobacter cavernae TaxID=2817681 RepID=A0A939KK07_9MICC|nr:helix-turn-helix domain-containing protein [Arthrobacter cavernae]MBO1268274.1 helix-turn-helix domain-containing protein [Arthrobacter cavernae]
MTTEQSSPASRTAGSQTLARGLNALKAIAASRDGLAINDVAEVLGVHRTIAYRILNTLSDAGMIRRSDDNRYRGAAGLLQLTSAAHDALRAAAIPVLTDIAGELGSTVSLLIREGGEAVALAVVEPRGLSYHISFAEGSRHPLHRGAAGLAIQASYPPSSTETDAVRTTRQNGYAITFGEVEPNMYGLAAPIKGAGPDTAACINLITTRKELAESSVPAIIAAAERISGRLA